jgi:ABC-type nitrate/sulfonate/bicarbonate transport system permease component
MTTESRPIEGVTSLGLSRLASSPWIVRLIAGVVLLSIWELGVRAWAPAYVARPSGVAAVFASVITSGAFLSAAAATLGSVLEGLLIALVFGIAVGIAMGRSFVVDRLIRYYVFGLFAMPMVAIVPLITLWFDLTDAARLATTVFAAFFSIVLNAADGARAVPLDYLEVAQSFRSPRWRILLDIVVPASMPYLLAGIRLAAARALIGAVVAEFFISVNGLGFFILFNSRSFRHNQAMVAVIVLGACGVGIETLVNWATRRYLPWYHHDEKAR